MRTVNQIDPTLGKENIAQQGTTTEFKLLFCRYTRSPVEEFEHTLFKRSLYPHARLIAPLLLRAHPEMFREDLANPLDAPNLSRPDQGTNLALPSPQKPMADRGS